MAGSGIWARTFESGRPNVLVNGVEPKQHVVEGPPLQTLLEDQRPRPRRLVAVQSDVCAGSGVTEVAEVARRT